MRTLMLALMIALLPIRGWLGDAMAVEMARHAMPAVASASAEAAESVMAGAHCHEMMGAGGDMADMAMDHGAAHGVGDSHDSSQHDTDIGHQGCGTCTACQACHTVALGGLPAAAIAHEAPQAPPAFHATRFASTEPAPGLKPPIS